MATKEKEIDAGRMYVATDSVSLPDGRLIRCDERRSGSDPLVVDYPDWWVSELDSTPEQIWAEQVAKQERALRADPERQARRQAEQREVVVCVRSLVNPATGDEVRLGEQFLDVHPLVTANPDHFKPRDEVFPEAAA